MAMARSLAGTHLFDGDWKVVASHADLPADQVLDTDWLDAR